MIPATPTALFALTVLAAAPAPSRSGPIAIRVEFEAPAGCSDVDAFYAAVLSRVERARRAGPGEGGVRLQVRLSKARNRVEGELRVLDGRGGGDRRTVSGLTCDEVVEGLSLTAALALDPGAREAPPARVAARPAPPAGTRSSGRSPGDNAPAAPAGSPSAPAASADSAPPMATAPLDVERTPEPLPPLPPAPPPSVPPTPPEPPVVSSPASPPAVPGRFGLAVGLNALAAAVVSPYFSTGGALSLRVVPRPTEGVPASFGLALLHLPNRWVLPDEDLVIDLTGAALTACPGWGIGRAITLQPCARVLGGWLRATNDAVTNPRTAGRSWWAVGALARAAVRLGAGFSLEMELGFAVPLVERRFVTTTPERLVGETPTISTIVGLGLVRGL